MTDITEYSQSLTRLYPINTELIEVKVKYKEVALLIKETKQKDPEYDETRWLENIADQLDKKVEELETAEHGHKRKNLFLLTMHYVREVAIGVASILQNVIHWVASVVAESEEKINPISGEIIGQVVLYIHRMHVPVSAISLSGEEKKQFISNIRVHDILQSLNLDEFENMDVSFVNPFLYPIITSNQLK